MGSHFEVCCISLKNKFIALSKPKKCYLHSTYNYLLGLIAVALYREQLQMFHLFTLSIVITV